METNAGNQRVKVELHDPSVNSWDPATYCNPTSGPGQEEYHVLVKAGQMWLLHAKCRQLGNTWSFHGCYCRLFVQGYTNEVKQWCPVPLLGKFTYQHHDGPTTTCSSSSDLRVCPDWTTMAFNYSLCSTTQAFSRMLYTEQ